MISKLDQWSGLSDFGKGYHTILIGLPSVWFDQHNKSFLNIVAPRFNELLGITNNSIRSGKSYSKMYETEP